MSMTNADGCECISPVNVRREFIKFQAIEKLLFM